MCVTERKSAISHSTCKETDVTTMSSEIPHNEQKNAHAVEAELNIVNCVFNSIQQMMTESVMLSLDIKQVNSHLKWLL